MRSLFKIDFVYDCSAEIIRFITEFFLSFVHVAISMPDVELGIQNPSAASVPQAQQHHVAPKRSVMVQAPFPNQLEFRFSRFRFVGRWHRCLHARPQAAAKALAVKNLIFQKRNICGTITLILVPLLL